MTTTVRVCPKCAAPCISEAPISVGGWLVPATYYCESEGCGYSGPVYVEVDADELDTLREVMNGDASKD